MIENDIKKLLPDWELKKQIYSTQTRTIYEATKKIGENVRHSLINVVALPSISEYDNPINSVSVLESAKKCQRDFTLLRGFADKKRWLSLRETYSVSNDEGSNFLMVSRLDYAYTLEGYIAKFGLSEGAIIELGVDLLKAVEVMREQNVHHGAISPEKIFVSENSFFRLGDIDSEISKGKKNPDCTFSEPQYAKTGILTEKSDIYSIGFIMYWLMNARKLPFFEGDTEKATQRRLSGEKLPLPSYKSNKELTEIVMKSCEADANNRFVSPKKMRKALETLQEKTKSGLIQAERERLEKATRPDSEANSNFDIDETSEEKKNYKKLYLKELLAVIIAVLLCVGGVFGYKYEKKTNISSLVTKIQSGYDKIYDGKEKTPSYTVKGLTEGVDYVVTYENNVEVGSATAYIKGIGKYHGTKERHFNITPGNIDYLKCENLTSNSLTLAWEESEGAEKYKLSVYDDITHKWDKIATIKGLSYEITELQPNREYQFRIIGEKRISKGKYLLSQGCKLTVNTLK